MPPGDYQRPRWQARCQSKLLSSLARHAGQQITHTDLRQVEQDVLIWGPRPSLGILVPCSLAAKGGWVEHPELRRRKYKGARITAGTAVGLVPVCTSWYHLVPTVS